MPSEYRLSIVLPAFNEETNVERAVRSATTVAERLCVEHEIIVVDDGSRDQTAAIVTRLAAEDPRIRLIQHPGNLGYGEALRSGFQAARLELVFFTDSDNQFDLNELEAFLPWSDRVDVVAGYRIRRQDPWRRRAMAKAWNAIVRVLFYVPVRDIDCAFKLFRRSVFERVGLRSVGAMVNTELMVQVGRSGNAVVELGVTHLPRTSGTPRGANPKVIARAVIELVRMYQHLHAAGIERPASPTPSKP